MAENAEFPRYWANDRCYFHGRNLVLQHQALTERIIGLAIEVHRKTGPGLLESVYAACLYFEL
jgi:PD-(D/E)XK nuclease superfamily